jgi:hypothetical protein
MGYEFITQPQVFMSPITAAMGLQEGIERYPYIVNYANWTHIVGPTNQTSITVPVSVSTMADRPEAWIINVGGVIQDPSKYTVNVSGRTINFNFTLSAGLIVNLRQLATSVPSAQEFNFAKATNLQVTNILTAVNMDVTNLLARNVEIINPNVFIKQTITNMVSALAITVNGNTVYLPLLSAI